MGSPSIGQVINVGCGGANESVLVQHAVYYSLEMWWCVVGPHWYSTPQQFIVWGGKTQLFTRLWVDLDLPKTRLEVKFVEYVTFSYFMQLVPHMRQKVAVPDCLGVQPAEIDH